MDGKYERANGFGVKIVVGAVGMRPGCARKGLRKERMATDT